MSVSLWRIATDTPSYGSTDLAGIGAEISGGRWNAKGTPVVYASTSIALATLETLVHIDSAGLPMNRYLVRIDVPEEVWGKRTTFEKALRKPLQVGWDAEPAAYVSIEAGQSWLNSLESVLFDVPSVLVPEERNVLLNPSHPDIEKMVVTKIRKFVYDGRLMK